MPNNNVIEVTLSTGTVLPYRATKAKSGNEYHAILDPNTGMPPARRTGGVPVDASVIGGALPTFCDVLGVRVPLERGQSDFGVPNVHADRVPITYMGEQRVFSIKIGHGKSFRVSGSINRPGGGGGSVRTSL